MLEKNFFTGQAASRDSYFRSVPAGKLRMTVYATDCGGSDIITVGSCTTQVHDLIDDVLLVRAEPEQEFYLQRLRKIILKLLQNCAFDSTRIAVWAILYLRFAPVRVNATSQLVPFQLEAVQGFSVFPFCLTAFFEKWV